MSTKKLNLTYVIPVLMSFFVMSFIDLVGTGVDEFKKDVGISTGMAQFMAFAGFIWFFFLSVPVSIWQNKIGKRKALYIGVFITALALVMPALGYNLPVLLISFSLVGIGNVILQMSANPLLVDVVPTSKASSFLSLSQSVKSLGSYIGPKVAGVAGPWLAGMVGFAGTGEWRFGLYLFAFVSIMTALWLASVNIEESKPDESKETTFASCMGLLSNKYVLMMVMIIFAIVGVDVAVNTKIGTFLVNKFGMDINDAKYVKQDYFLAKMIGTFIGAILLAKLSSKKFLIGSAVLGLAAFIALAFSPSINIAKILVILASLGIANVFPLAYSLAVAKMPERANEITGLMMMAISGGAFIPLFVGFGMDANPAIGAFILAGCMLYVLLAGLKTDDIKQD